MVKNRQTGGYRAVYPDSRRATTVLGVCSAWRGYGTRRMRMLKSMRGKHETGGFIDIVYQQQHERVARSHDAAELSDGKAGI